MKCKLIIFLVINFFFFSSCSNNDSKTKEMLGSWEVAQINISSDILKDAVKIEFFEGTKDLVNLFYIYLPNGEKYEGQWKIYKNEFFMKFHSSGFDFDEDRIFTESFNLTDNQFTCKGTYRHFTSSDTYDDDYFLFVLRR